MASLVALLLSYRGQASKREARQLWLRTIDKIPQGRFCRRSYRLPARTAVISLAHPSRNTSRSADAPLLPSEKVMIGSL